MWPDGARCAAAFTFDFDAEEAWIAEDWRNARRPTVLSQGTYGAKVAVPLLLELLARHGITATFFVPGRVAQRYPDRVTEIVAAGHELAHHGYTHRPPAQLTAAEEEDELVRGLEALRGFGTEITGYRAPAWDVSRRTIDLLRAHGLTYSSNLMDDIRPYRHRGTGVVEVPVQWTLNDAPYFWFSDGSWTKAIATTESVRSIWTAEFEGIRKLGGACVITMHPQTIGRPGRLQFLDEFLGFVRGHDDVWLATTAQIAARALSSGPLASRVRRQSLRHRPPARAGQAHFTSGDDVYHCQLATSASTASARAQRRLKRPRPPAGIYPREGKPRP